MGTVCGGCIVWYLDTYDKVREFNMWAWVVVFMKENGKRGFCRELKNRKTIFHYRLKGWGVVFFLILFLPFIVTVVWSGGGEGEEGDFINKKAESGIRVRLQGESGVVLSMEEYLYGCLPAVIPVEYEMECLKAQAVLLRTCLIGQYMEGLQNGSGWLEEDSYLNRVTLQALWGTDYADYYEKIKQAVDETRGVYIVYDGSPIVVSYFRVSAGRTRDGGEVLDGEYPYLKIVECGKDYLSDDYLSQIILKGSEMETLLGGKLDRVVIDSAGYCRMVVTEEGVQKSGEWIREQLKLASTHITFTQNADEYILTVRGLGHGLGMSQFAANEMAREGKSYDIILSNFFHNISLDKYE